MPKVSPLLKAILDVIYKKFIDEKPYILVFEGNNDNDSKNNSCIRLDGNGVPYYCKYHPREKLSSKSPKEPFVIQNKRYYQAKFVGLVTLCDSQGNNCYIN